MTTRDVFKAFMRHSGEKKKKKLSRLRLILKPEVKLVSLSGRNSRLGLGSNMRDARTSDQNHVGFFIGYRSHSGHREAARAQSAK
jgi:hypothetical protein